jgi:acyl carrier protein
LTDVTQTVINIAQQVFSTPVTEQTLMKSIPGSSLHLMQFKSAIEQQLDCTIPLEVLFGINSIAQLVPLLAQYANVPMDEGEF